MNKILSTFTNLYAVWVISASILAFLIPDLFLWFSGKWITWALSIVMLGMGLTLKVTHFRRVLEMPRLVALGFIAQYSIMPASAWTIAYILKLEPAFAVGLILVACCPGGTASNVVAYLARANVALSVVLTMVSTLLAIIMTPLLMQHWAGHFVPIDALGIFKTTLQVVLIPVVLGVYLNQRFPRIGTAASDVGPAVAVMAIVMIAASIVASNVEAIAGHGLQLALAGFLLHSVGFAVGYGFTRIFRYSKNTARTISIEVGMQNSGLAMVLAQQHFAAATATPAVFSSVFHTVVGSICAAYWRMRPSKDHRDKTGRNRQDIYYWKCDRPATFYGTKRKADSGKAETLIQDLQPLISQKLAEPNLTVTLLNGKGDHLTYLIKTHTKNYFARVQDGPDNDDYMEIVSELSNRVAEQTSVPIARTIIVDSTRIDVPFAYQVVEYFEYPDLNELYKKNGIPLHSLAKQIGSDVARWQSIRLAGYGLLDSDAFRVNKRICGLHETYEKYYRLNWQKHLQFLHDNDFLSHAQVQKLEQIVDDHSRLLQLTQGCLVHKDLALWNILGTPDEVKAYIDWDDAISGDPTDDLSLLACFHDSEFMMACLDGYQSIKPLPENFSKRFWLHLIRNMVFKAVIRVGSGYFKTGKDLFLLPPGATGKSLERITKDRLWAAYNGLLNNCDIQDLTMLVNKEGTDQVD